MTNTKFPTWEEYILLTDEEIGNLERIVYEETQASSQEEYDSNEEYYESKLQIT